MTDVRWVMALALVLVAVMLGFAAVAFTNATIEIAKKNADTMMDCFMMKCDISPMGALSCSYYDPDFVQEPIIRIRNHYFSSSGREDLLK